MRRTRSGHTRSFRDLDPNLALAERLLAEDSALRSVASQLPDESAAVDELNRLLEAAAATFRLAGTDARWRIVLHGGTAGREDLVAAAFGLARLVSQDGWRRIKHCRAVACPGVFIDRTNGATRRYCDTHSTHRQAGQSD